MDFVEEKLENVTTKQINSYILELIKSKNISTSQQNQRINAIKFYYEKALVRKKEYYELHRPGEENKFHGVLSKKEVKGILDSTDYIKEEYKHFDKLSTTQLFLSLQFGSIRTITIHNRWQPLKTERQ